MRKKTKTKTKTKNHSRLFILIQNTLFYLKILVEFQDIYILIVEINMNFYCKCVYIYYVLNIFNDKMYLKEEEDKC